MGREGVRKGPVEGGEQRLSAANVRKRSGEWDFGRGLQYFSLPHSFSYVNWTSEQDALQVLKPTNDTDMADALDAAKPADAAIAQRLREVLSNLFAALLGCCR